MSKGEKVAWDIVDVLVKRFNGKTDITIYENDSGKGSLVKPKLLEKWFMVFDGPDGSYIIKYKSRTAEGVQVPSVQGEIEVAVVDKRGRITLVYGEGERGIRESVEDAKSFGKDDVAMKVIDRVIYGY